MGQIQYPMKFLFTPLLCLLALVASAQDACNITDAVNIQAYSYAYSPQNVTVDAGTTVSWTNTGGFHDVNGETNTVAGGSFNNPVAFSLPAISGSSSSPTCIGSYTFTVPGVYSYDCSIGSHAANGMVGTITVVAAGGCTDAAASNYDAGAGSDDGSCLYSAQYVNATYNSGYADGAASVECPEAGCAGDLDGDGAIAINDLLAYLTVFGGSCTE